jgi:hypothetical protein
MPKKQQEEKIDIFNASWRDEFEDDFYFVRGAVDLARGCSSQEGCGISDGSIPTVLEEAVNKLDDLHSLIDRVFKSIFEIKKLTPEQEKQRKTLKDLEMQEVTMAIGKISQKFEKKVKMIKGEVNHNPNRP